MEKLINKKINKYEDFKHYFENNIQNKEIYNFLTENKIDLKEAYKYFYELQTYQKNPDKYDLHYQYGNIILEEKNKNHNQGIYYLDEIYFKKIKTLEELDYENNQSKAKIVSKFLKKPSKGMYLYSDNGIGKTSLILALSIIDFQLNKNKTLFVFWPDFIEKTKRFEKNDNISFINKVKYAQKLIIDDLGQESITSWARDDILHSIISYRLEKKLITYITSNYTPDELQNIYTFRTAESKKTKSLVSKITALSEPNLLTGINYRMKGKDERE